MTASGSRCAPGRRLILFRGLGITISRPVRVAMDHMVNRLRIRALERALSRALDAQSENEVSVKHEPTVEVFDRIVKQRNGAGDRRDHRPRSQVRPLG